MGKGQGSLRRTAGIGAFVAIVVLALSLPSIAFAANTTIFRGMTPKAGSSTSVSKPKISVICYDKYGVKGARKTSMTLDGVKVAKTLTWYRGWHHKKFKLTYKVPSALSLGSHKVVVRVVDLKLKHSRKTWRFTVVARTPPDMSHHQSTSSCVQSGCHVASLTVLHNVNGHTCATCHSSTDPKVVAAIAAGSDNCFDCHDPAPPTHPGVTHTVSGPCFNAACHSTDVTVIHSAWANPPGCAACHGAGKTPSLDCATCHSNIGTVHDFAHADASGTKSTACTACHGTDLPTVHTAVGCACHTAPYLVGEMTTLLAAGKAECVDCHKGDHAAHGFDKTASGHSTTTYGTRGPLTKFDGTQGVTLKWKAEETTTLGGFADGRNGIYTVDEIATVTTAWQFPTVNVFWKSDDASAPDTAIKGLTKDSVITCQDCHTGLNASGPHGAAQNWGLDPNYPGDYSYAELTKYVTCNSQYVATDLSEPNHANYLTPLSVSGIAMRSGLTSAATLKSRTDGTKGATAVICAKCHDLENYNAASNIVEGANTAHDSHHQDNADGSAQCVNCHIGVPHGWKMPRLLVDTDVDVAPYRDPQQIGTTRAFSSGNNTGDTRALPGAWNAGFNGQGMQALSGVNDHPLGGPGGTQPYGVADGLPTAILNLGHNGMAYWSEQQCEACGEHTGETPAQIINEP